MDTEGGDLDCFGLSKIIQLLNESWDRLKVILTNESELQKI